ncbi:MAG: TonB-dependent receptor, partial [Micropepsaceae bacterium]
ADFNGVPDDFRTVIRSNFPFKEEVTSLNFDTRLEAHFDTGSLAHYLLVGLDYRDFENGSKFGFAFDSPTASPRLDLFNPVYGTTAIVTPALSFTFLDQQEKQTGLYVQDQMKSGHWIFTLTGRQDWVDTTNAGVSQDLSEFTYRAGINYVTDSGVAPYIAYATSFQPTKPGFDFGTFTNVLLKPSTGQLTEVGIKWDGRSLPEGIKVFASGAYYSLKQDNVVTPGPDVRYPFGTTQVGEVEVQGIELEAVARFYERLSLNGSYTFTDSEIVNSSNPVQIGQPMPMVPDHKASLFADYTWQDGPLAGFGAGLGVRYVSETFGDPGTYKFPNEAVTLADGSIHYDLADWRIQLNGSNLFDKDYVARCNSDQQCFFGTRGVYTITLTKKFGSPS